MERLIKTDLCGNKNYEMLQSVIGQMSDGIWENSPSMNRYWQNATIKLVDGVVAIEVSNWYDSPYRNKTDQQVLDYFAKKLKEIVKIYMDDYCCGEWKRDNHEVVDYLGYKDTIDISDAYKAYDILKNRDITRLW